MNMATELLFDLLSGRISLDNFCDWISGKETQDISSSLNRTDFVLHVLNYIQASTSKFITSEPQSKEKEDKELRQKKDAEKKTNNNESKKPENKSEPNQRAPFKVINKASPSKTPAQPFSRFLNHRNETHGEIQNCSINFEQRNFNTSTPVRNRKNSRNDHFPISPRSSSGSFHSDQSVNSLTPRSNKSFGNRFNSSSGSHRSSPQFNTPTFSPTSPQYTDNFPDLSGKRHSQKSRKRIKPTQLMSSPDKDMTSDIKQGNKGFGVVSRPFIPITTNLQLQTEVEEKLKLEEERNLIKQKRVHSAKYPEVMSPPSVVSVGSAVQDETRVVQQILTKPPVVTPVSTPASSGGSVDPDPSKVVCADKLVRLAAVYSACLDANLIPNVTTELYFIFTLLTFSYKSKVKIVKTPKDSVIVENSVDPVANDNHCSVSLQQLSLDDAVQSLEAGDNQTEYDEKCVLCSVHNCVMFAAVVIEKQIHLVQNLDRVVIRLLLKNSRLSLFVPHFIPHLTHIAELKDANEKERTSSKKASLLANGPVLYHAETDSKDNFSSDSNFFLFKKQRDGFYEVLREWQLNNGDSTWTSKRFPVRIQNLLKLSKDPVNLMHLARLFCAQLTSLNVEQSEDGPELPGVTKDKLSLLKARFSKPSETKGTPRPPPQFPGEQQFYLQFLEETCGSPLQAHVVDCLLYRLNILDRTAFFNEGMADESKCQVQACISDCCLLAKFLGLVVFLPYRSDTQSLPDTLQNQALVRQMVVPPVDVNSYLQRALANNRLVVTVPWVVAFLGMMDAATPLLPSYRPALQQLAALYCKLPLAHISPLSSLLLRYSLGWLFDVSFFPEAVFLSLVTSSPQLEGRSTEPADVDVKDVVDQTLLSEVCPFLGCLRVALSTNSSSKRGTARHITPVPAHHTPTSLTPVQIMELQLEESFINGQAPSFRMTLEFVSDRMSSSCKKYICSSVIATCKERAAASLFEQKEQNTKISKEQIQSLVTETCQTTQAQIEVALADYCGPKVKGVLVDLLGPDANDPSVFRSAHSICGRWCRERVVNWLNSRIKLQDIFSKLLNAADVKPNEDQSSQPCENKKAVEHRNSAMSPSCLIVELQERLCQCIENRNLPINEQYVLDFVEMAIETVKFRTELIPPVEQVIYTTSVDYCVVLIAHFSHLVTPLVIQQLCSLWAACDSSESPLERVLSSRNVLLLCQAGQQQAKESWRKLSSLLVELLKEGLLTPKQLEAQCVALFRQDWPPMVHTLMGACLSFMLENIKQDPKCNRNPKLVLMLEWAHEMTNELARGDICEDI